MKADIHPKYNESIEIRCSCGNIVHTGSTKENMKTELCSKCHPFYTGHQKLVDTAGMVDKFQARTKAAELHKQAVIEHDRLKKMKKEEPAFKPRKVKPKKAPVVTPPSEDETIKKLSEKKTVKKVPQRVAKKVTAKKPAKATKKTATKKTKK